MFRIFYAIISSPNEVRRFPVEISFSSIENVGETSRINSRVVKQLDFNQSLQMKINSAEYHCAQKLKTSFNT